METCGANPLQVGGESLTCCFLAVAHGQLQATAIGCVEESSVGDCAPTHCRTSTAGPVEISRLSCDVSIRSMFEPINKDPSMVNRVQR